MTLASQSQVRSAWLNSALGLSSPALMDEMLFNLAEAADEPSVVMMGLFFFVAE